MEALGRQLWNQDWPAALLARSIERADGVPFILEELLRSADATGAAGWPVAAAKRGVRDPCAAAAASAEDQDHSPRRSACSDEEVEIQLATAVLDVEVGELLSALFELERFAFVHPLAGHSMRFRHQMIAQACANTIPRDRRQKIHRAAIRTITQQYPSLHGRYEQLAFHAEEAGEAELALGYLWEAALEARRNSAATSLSLIFDRALSLVASLGEVAEEKYVDFVLMSFASMLQLGEFDKMSTHLARTMELAQRQGRAAQVCAAQAHLGMICWFEGRYEEGLLVTSEGLEDGPRAGVARTHLLEPDHDGKPAAWHGRSSAGRFRCWTN